MTATTEKRRDKLAVIDAELSEINARIVSYPDRLTEAKYQALRNGALSEPAGADSDPQVKRLKKDHKDDLFRVDDLQTERDALARLVHEDTREDLVRVATLGRKQLEEDRVAEREATARRCAAFVAFADAYDEYVPAVQAYETQRVEVAGGLQAAGLTPSSDVALATLPGFTLPLIPRTLLAALQVVYGAAVRNTDIGTHAARALGDLMPEITDRICELRGDTPSTLMQGHVNERFEQQRDGE